MAQQKANKQKVEDTPVQPQPAAVALPKAPDSIAGLQQRTMKPAEVDETYHVRLVLDNQTAFSLPMQQSVLVALLDPAVPDGFIEVSGAVRTNGDREDAPGVHRFLHTSFIREVVFRRDLPEGVLGGEA